MFFRNLENCSTLKLFGFCQLIFQSSLNPPGSFFDPAMTPRGRGQKPRRGRGLQFWTGFWPRGAGVKIFFRGHGPRGAGVKIFFRGQDPAGVGAIKRGRGFDPVCYGAIKRGRGFGPACCGAIKRGRGRGQNGVWPRDPVLTPFAIKIPGPAPGSELNYSRNPD